MLPIVSQATQADEALSLLARMYHRWFLQANEAQEETYQHIRDICSHAPSQQAALADLTAQIACLSPASQEVAIWQAARETLQAVMDAQGRIETLIIGQTDGFRHLCLACGQDAQSRQRVRFFNERACRPLLKPEITGELRSAYARCHHCCQPLNPNVLVVLLPMGTQKHTRSCACRACNRAGIASLLSIYACEPATQHIRLPRVLQIAAPSKQQCQEQAVKACWERGWYIVTPEQIPH